MVRVEAQQTTSLTEPSERKAVNDTSLFILLSLESVCISVADASDYGIP